MLLWAIQLITRRTLNRLRPIGPIVAVLSFVCSVGNIPLAAVLCNGGISFGGVIAFIYADLIVLPIINTYRKYYGWKATAFVVGIFYLAMAAAALIIESVFRILGLVPQERKLRSSKPQSPSTIRLC